MTTDCRLAPASVLCAKAFDNNPHLCQTSAKTPIGPSLAILIALLFAIVVSLTDNLIASQSVALTWTASTSSVAGYNAYRGSQSGGPYILLNSSLVTGTAYSDVTVQAGQTYYYVATAVDSNNNESAYSNEASVTVPVPSQLAATPSSVAFGNVPTGSNSTQTVTLSNTGSTSVVVSGETLTGTGFSTSGLVVPLTLTGGQSSTFSVSFAPTATGSVTGSVSMVSNASNSPTTVSLSGTGITASSHSVDLTWNASTSAVAGYNAYRGNVSGGPYTRLNSSLIAGLNYTDYSVQAGQTYFYVATAVNANSVESVYSNQAQATVPASRSVGLSWTASTSMNVSGYNAYRGTQSGGPYTKLNSSLVTRTAYTDTTVQAGQTYFYVATAVDSNNNESAYSNQAQTSVPSP
jgi:fibronectin type 3 domain-containing protein